MTNKKSLLLAAGAVILCVTGIAVYLKSNSIPDNRDPSKSKDYWFSGVNEPNIEVDNNWSEGDKESLKKSITSVQEIQPSEARFHWSDITYSNETEGVKKLTGGKFELSAFTLDGTGKSTGILVKTELKESKHLSGVVVSMSKAKDATSWTMEKGFGFSTENFDKELKIDSSGDSTRYFKYGTGTESFFKVFSSSEEDNYQPLLGYDIKKLKDAKITKFYVKDENQWKKTKDIKTDDVKDDIRNAINQHTKGVWTSSKPES